MISPSDGIPWYQIVMEVVSDAGVSRTIILLPVCVTEDWVPETRELSIIIPFPPELLLVRSRLKALAVRGSFNCISAFPTITSSASFRLTEYL
jgi:hypothetical protein